MQRHFYTYFLVEGPTSFWVAWFLRTHFGAKRVYQFVTQTMTYNVTGKWPHMHLACFASGRGERYIALTNCSKRDTYIIEYVS